MTIPIHWALFKDVIRSRTPRLAGLASTRRVVRDPLVAAAVAALVLASAVTPDAPAVWPWWFVLIFALDSVVVAVREELVYRGALQTLLERRGGLARALAISNLIFLVYHWRAFDFTPPRALTIVLVGTALGLLYAGTGSLKLPMLVHFAYDAVIVLRPFVPPLVSPQLWAAINALAGIVTLVLQLAAVTLLVVWLRRRSRAAWIL